MNIYSDLEIKHSARTDTDISEMGFPTVIRDFLRESLIDLFFFFFF